MARNIVFFHFPFQKKDPQIPHKIQSRNFPSPPLLDFKNIYHLLSEKIWDILDQCQGLILYFFFRNIRFPLDEWLIRLDELLDSTVGDGSTSKLSAEVLVQVDNSARVSGCFKVIFSGVDTLKLDLPAENLIIMGGAASYRIKMKVKPQDIVLRTNSTTSEWFDLMER